MSPSLTRTRIILVILLLLSVSSPGAVAAIRPVTLADITDRVSRENYFVQENAERVYQAKAAIQLARRNLLPKVNLWRAADAVVNPGSLLGLVEDIAPFLIPNNWLRVKEEKLFAEASVQGYRALWANELLTARGLLIQASLEERFMELLQQHSADLTRIYSAVKSREAMGAVPPGSSKQFEIRRLTLSEEIKTLSRVISENRTQLAYVLGFPGNDEVVPAEITYLKSEKSQAPRYADYEDRMLTVSNELLQYDSLIRAAERVRKSRFFNLLGISSASRNGPGSVFDSLPQQDGLGFGLGPSVQIVRSQKHILELQRNSVRETLRRSLKNLIASINLDLGAKEDAITRIELTRSVWKTLTDRLRMGGTLDIYEWVEASRSRIEAVSNYHTVETRLLLGTDRLNRLTLTDAYSVTEGALP